jgi:hypothetical protein
MATSKPTGADGVLEHLEAELLDRFGSPRLTATCSVSWRIKLLLTSGHRKTE